MLTPVDQAAASSSSGGGAVAQPETQVAATSGSQNTILYTVPAGRKAEVYLGHEYTGANNNDYYLNVDVGGILIRVWSGLSNQSNTYRSLTTPLLTLIAGTVVRTQPNNSGSAYILGVEKDAW